MTTIAADRASMACDSQGTADTGVCQNFGSKIVRVRRSVSGTSALIGYSGDYRVGRWARRSVLPLGSFSEVEDAWDEYMRQSCSRHREGVAPGCALVLTGGVLYECGGDGSVLIPEDGRSAVGAGSSFALGAMAHGASTSEAVEIAIRLDPYSGGPVHVESLDADA